jgi:hypothetical protein
MKSAVSSVVAAEDSADALGVPIVLIDSTAAGRDAVRATLNGREPGVGDVLVLFVSVDHDLQAVLRAARSEAAPARVVGCTSTGGFNDSGLVPSGCVAALLEADERSFGICHLQRDDRDVAGSARLAAQTARDRAGGPYPYSVLLLLADGLTPDQREIARGVYEVTTAKVPFVGGAAADDLRWAGTQTFAEDQILSNGLLAVWINSASPVGIGVAHGWRPTGRPMLVTRAAGTVVHELDGESALTAFLAEQGGDLDPADPDFFLQVLNSPVGCPNGRGRYDVRQLHAYLPDGGGINFNAAISEQTILQVMSGDRDGLIGGARSACEEAIAMLDRPASLALAFSCGSRTPLLGDRCVDEVAAMTSALEGAPLNGFYTYGEFARTTGSSGFHNSSVAVLAL